MTRQQAAFVLLAACLVPSALEAELTEQEQRGRQIYKQGTSASGAEIVALLGEARTEVPASVLPCGACHGAGGSGPLPAPSRTDGRGRPRLFGRPSKVGI